ncbi:MAG: cytochrome c peroxidase [Chitinophagaceae bacterium]|nr:cytochrome C peroxidase [Chitinophagaceae bacterium]
MKPLLQLNPFISKKINIILLLSAIIFSLQFSFKKHFPVSPVTTYYINQLQSLQEKLLAFKKATENNPGKKDLIQHFKECRLAYKQLAVLTDYFNPYETRQINSAAINRIEAEVVDKIIPPSGFQAIEDVLYNDWQETSPKKIDSLLEGILQMIKRFREEPGLAYKFKDELVWDALRSATLSIATTGITGLDSPNAQFSLPEAASSIEGIIQLLNLLQPAYEKKAPAGFAKLNSTLAAARQYVQAHENFNKFDRLQFITQYINPLYKLFVNTRIKTGIGIPPGHQVIHYDDTTFFGSGFFSINFYSPPQEYWVTPERVQLGKLLFNDPILSGTHTRSCASCHHPEKAFTDGLAKPLSLDNKTLLPRNTPTLYNAGFQTSQFYDSREDILENQLTEVVHNAEEMKGSLQKSVVVLKESPQYASLFQKAYPEEKKPLNTFTIANAIACYVRSLSSLNSRFDQYMLGDETQLSKDEKKGFNLFAGKAKCATCHFMPLFNGVVPPFFNSTESEVIGVPAGKNENPATLDEDLGKYNFIHTDIYKHSFKTPTLRNIALTAPYMHNGVFSTLEEVMDFYNKGGGKGLHIAPANQTLPFEKLKLSKKEMRQIILFMKTLTDTSALHQNKYVNHQ